MVIVQTIDLRLAEIARKVVWWEPPEITLSDQNDFLCRVMGRGIWEDVQYVERIFGEAAFREALLHCRPGVMDPGSWHYWHLRLRLEPIPELPKRTFA
jgi:hypothetical protein